MTPSPSSPSRSERAVPASRDRGSVLPLALVLTVVLSMVVVAIATYTTTALRSTRVTVARVDRLADAEAGLRRALHELATTGACPSSPSTLSHTGDNGSGVNVDSCEWEPIGTSAAADQYGLVLTAEGLVDEAAFRRLNPQNDVVEIGGPVFIGRHASGHANNVVAPDGADVQRTNCAGYNPEPVVWLITPTEPACTVNSWSDASPPPTGITLPTNGGTFSTGSCRIYEPGKYATIDTANNSYNYFRSGVYLIEGAITLRGHVTAGHPLESGSIGTNNARCRDAQLDNVEDGLGTGGVVMVFAGAAAITFTNQLDSFETYGYEVGGRRISVIAAPAGTDGLPSTTVDPRTQPILNSPPTPDFRFAGEVWAPHGWIDLGNLSSWQAGRGFLGGLTVSRINFRQTGGAVGGVLISLHTAPDTYRYRIVVTATDGHGVSTTVSAVARVGEGDVTLTSWRLR